MAATTKKISTKERVWYIIAALIGVIAITFIVFGIIGDHYPDVYSENWVASSENGWLKNWSGLGYRWWGVILLALSAALAALVLTLFAKEGDRDSERALRRAQRLGLASSEQKPESK